MQLLLGIFCIPASVISIIYQIFCDRVPDFMFYDWQLYSISGFVWIGIIFLTILFLKRKK